MTQPPSLVRQNAVWLALAFLAVELLATVAFVSLVAWPMARRSADDLAGLMVISAQTWAELPPHTRPAFEAELQRNHGLQLQPAQAGVHSDGWHPPFLYLLEAALARRVGTHQHVLRDTSAQGDTRYWATLPSGGQTLAVGLSAERMASQPVLALLAVLVLGLVVSVVLAWLLARRVVAPLAQLAHAAEQMGQGHQPDALPETGPREVVALSRSFNLMAAQVQQLLTARTALLAGVSHDLRTPLARMRLALEMLATHPNPSLVERLDRDVQHMNQIIGNVLDVARGVAHEAATLVDVAALLAQLALDHSTAARQVRVTVGADGAGVHRLPEVSLRRALNNLLENAFHHATSGQVELVCELTSGGLRMGVLDRGPGIAPHLVAQMCQPFQRADPSRNPATGGTGLGLAIVQALAQAHGWQLQLLPREGGGLAAWLYMASTQPDTATD